MKIHALRLSIDEELSALSKTVQNAEVQSSISTLHYEKHRHVPLKV